MPSLRRPLNRAVSASLAVALICAGAAALLILGSAARAASTDQLKQQINSGQGQISSLSGIVSTAGRKLGTLNSNISSLEAQIARIQADLDAKHAELLKTSNQLGLARKRLSQLEGYEQRDQLVLSRELVSGYETESPDLVSVVLEARGFQDLLERLAFAQRVRKQDVQIVTAVRSARRAVASQATRLGALETRQQQLTAQVLAQRNRLSASRVTLIQQQISVQRYHSAKASQLAGARDQVAGLEHQLSHLQAAQAAAARRAAAAQSSSSGPSSSGSAGSSSSGGSAPPSTSPPASSSGGFTFPMPKGDASPPGTWSLDQGVDISAPGGTPELAVCSGTIVLHGIGGFGPWAPVLHCDSPLDGYDYVYYGHAGPANQLSVGSHVSAGQVMSEVGPGIVGLSTGPHLEIGFADSSGSPVGGGSASTMMSLLQAAYNG